MGLLTDPSSSKRKSQMAKHLMRHQTLICIGFYVVGCIYLFSLAHPSRNNATYFSENALLPGKCFLAIQKIDYSLYPDFLIKFQAWYIPTFAQRR